MAFAYMNTGHVPSFFRLEELPVFFGDLQCLEVIEAVLEEDGRIKNFPGILEEESWLKKKRVALFPDVRYEAQFFPLEKGGYLMKWMIQPSGWYWADEYGFGRTSDESIVLYSILDAAGNFKQEFRLFSIGGRCYQPEFEAFSRC